MQQRRRSRNSTAACDDWSVDDFDAVEIRRSSSTKFDGAAVYIKVVYRMVRGAADLIINSQSLLNW